MALRTSTSYDKAGRSIAGINPLSEITTTVYDNADRTVATIDPLGRRSTTVYDNAGQTVAMINALGNRTTHTYDDASRRTALIDANGHQTDFTYDKADRQIRITNALSQIVTSGYDAAGRMNLRIDARTNRTTYAYDATSRITARKYPDGSRITWTYDAAGNPLVINQADGRYTRTYDSLNRVATVTGPDGTLQFSHDAAGRRSLLIDIDSGRTTYSYDAVGRIATLKNPDNEVTTWTWDAAGRQTLKQLANGTRTSTVYDDAGRITAVYHLKSDNSVISSFDYTNNEVGNRTSVLEADGDRVTWTYDATDQLTAEHCSGANAYSHTFTYDAVGNRLVKDIGTDRTTSVYDVCNRLETAEDASGVTSYTFDADGNQRSIESPTNDLTTYSWSYESKLRQVEEPLGSVYTYTHALVQRDGTEQRVSKDDGLDVTRFLWDAKHLQAEADDLGTVTARYDYEPAEYGHLISQRQNAETNYHHFDALGSTTELTDASEVATDSARYEAFGTEHETSGTTPNPHRWVGQLGYYKDEESSLYSIRQRTLDLQTGRWLSQDPTRDDEQSLYRYVINNSPNAIDPSGEDFISFESGSARWNVRRKRDGFVNTLKSLLPFDSHSFTLGTYNASSSSITLNRIFGGDEIDADVASEIAKRFWQYYPDISDMPVFEQAQTIRKALHDQDLHDSATSDLIASDIGQLILLEQATGTRTFVADYFKHNKHSILPNFDELWKAYYIATGDEARATESIVSYVGAPGVLKQSAAVSHNWKPRPQAVTTAKREHEIRKLYWEQALKISERSSKRLRVYQEAAVSNAGWFHAKLDSGFDARELIPMYKGMLDRATGIPVIQKTDKSKNGISLAGRFPVGFWAVPLDTAVCHVFLRVPRLLPSWPSAVSKYGMDWPLVGIYLEKTDETRPDTYGGPIPFPVYRPMRTTISGKQISIWSAFPADPKRNLAAILSARKSRQEKEFAEKLANVVEVSADILIGMVPLVGSIRDISREGLTLRTAAGLAIDIGSTFFLAAKAAQAVAKTAKIANRLGKSTKAITRAVVGANRIGKVLTIGGAAMQATVGINDLRNAEGFLDGGAALLTILESALIVAGAARIKNNAKDIHRDILEARRKYEQSMSLPTCLLKAVSCFPAGTPVATDRGLEPIETITKDRRVWSFDVSRGTWQLAAVADTFQREYDDDIISIRVAGDVIRTTARHPFWVVAGEHLTDRPTTAELECDTPPGPQPGRWVEAGHLRTGDVLLTRDQGELRVEVVAVRKESLTVYNLQIAEHRTYTVGNHAILVHNTSRRGKPCERLNVAKKRSFSGSTKKSREGYDRIDWGHDGTDFEGVLRGIKQKLPGVKKRRITYKKLDAATAKAARSRFNSTDRKKFLQGVVGDPQKVSNLKKAGLTDIDIAKMRNGHVPTGYQVHHKIPIDAGGSNDPSNLILMKNEPFHKTITNYQNSLTSGMKPGDVKTFDYPIPGGFIYPP